MLIIDDDPTFRALTNDYSWIPAGHNPSELVTTTEWHYRLLIGIVKPEPQGIHSRRFHEVDKVDRQRPYNRALAPAPVVTLLDTRLSLNTAADIKTTIGRIGFLISDAIASAIVHEAELAVVDN
jgi:hypothetical protein